MLGRVCVVTGGNAGIGKATATALARQGAHVVLGCRSMTKGNAACEDIRRSVPGAEVEALPLDLEKFESVRGFVDRFRETGLPLHVLVNNAGLIAGKQETMHGGMEKTQVVNHLGPFLLTNLLLPDLRKSAASTAATSSSPGFDGEKSGELIPPRASRIVNVSSRLEKNGGLPMMMEAGHVKFPPPGTEWFHPPAGDHHPWKQYATSKLCSLLFTFELDRRLARSVDHGSGGRVSVNAVTPGIVNTGLAKDLLSPWVFWAARLPMGLFARNVEKGAETVVWAASSQEAENVGGKFFGDMNEVPCSENAKDEELAKELWEACEVVTGLNRDSSADGTY